MNTILFALAIAATPAQSVTHPNVITVSETVIAVPARMHCETRELVQGSGTVKVCERVRGAR